MGECSQCIWCCHGTDRLLLVGQADAIVAKYPYCITDGIAPPRPSESAASGIGTVTVAGLGLDAALAGGSTAFQDAIIQGVSQRLLAAVQDAISGPSTAALVPAGEAADAGPSVSMVLTHGAPHRVPTDSVAKAHMLKLGNGTLHQKKPYGYRLL